MTVCLSLSIFLDGLYDMYLWLSLFSLFTTDANETHLDCLDRVGIGWGGGSSLAFQFRNVLLSTCSSTLNSYITFTFVIQFLVLVLYCLITSFSSRVSYSLKCSLTFNFI